MGAGGDRRPASAPPGLPTFIVAGAAFAGTLAVYCVPLLAELLDHPLSIIVGREHSQTDVHGVGSRHHTLVVRSDDPVTMPKKREQYIRSVPTQPV
jgi:hypothetical protein